jgi:spore maturation protein CgeB
MCGMPLVSTDNYDIGRYFKHKRDAIISNDKDELRKGIKLILSDDDIRLQYSARSREIALKNFHSY